MYKSYKFDTNYTTYMTDTTYKSDTTYKTDTTYKIHMIWIFFTSSKRNRHGEHSEQNSVS